MELTNKVNSEIQSQLDNAALSIKNRLETITQLESQIKDFKFNLTCLEELTEGILKANHFPYVA